MPQKWDESLFLEEIDKRHGAQLRTLAKDLIDWSKTWADFPRFGEDTQKANYFPYLDDKNKNTCPFSIYATTGKIEIQFKRLVKLAAFEDEKRRLELLSKLNQIEGVDIPENKAKNGKPPIRMALLLNPQSLRKFEEAIEWAIQKILKD